MASKFEYMRLDSALKVTVDPNTGVKTISDLLVDLNTLGADGWEIVFVWPDGTHVLLKRQK